MNTALRANSELSSIDTTLLLAGILYSKQYFDGTNADETNIRVLAGTIFNRVDWNWMAQGTNVLSMAWYPDSGFISNNWIGYNEGMIIYCLGLGAMTNPLPASAWARWTSGYIWATELWASLRPICPFVWPRCSHCWIDFRHIADPYMNTHGSTYFENPRRASLAQVAYCTANPNNEVGYSSNVWGLTACDGPPPIGLLGAWTPADRAGRWHHRTHRGRRLDGLYSGILVADLAVLLQSLSPSHLDRIWLS